MDAPNLAFIGQAVSEKKIFEIMDDGRTDDGLIGILYAHLVSLRLRWAKNIFFFFLLILFSIFTPEKKISVYCMGQFSSLYALSLCMLKPTILFPTKNDLYSHTIMLEV